jgi:hypothetical protein
LKNRSTARQPGYSTIKFAKGLLLATALFTLACRERPRPPAENVVIWRSLGSWSGQGSTQTGPFISDTGTLRLRWDARNETTPGNGTFKVTVHSDVSGRPLAVAVDRKGAGADTAFVYEDPRPFFLVIESANLDWTISADEPVSATSSKLDKR